METFSLDLLIMDLGQLFTDEDDQDSNRHIPEQRVPQESKTRIFQKAGKCWADWLDEE